MGVFSEAKVVQHPLVRYASEIGWAHLSRDDALRQRRGETGPLLWEVLVDQLQRLNPGVLDLHRAEDVVNRLARVRPSIEGNLDAWEFLRGLKTVFVPEERRELNVRLLATDQPDRNTFHVTEEFAFTNGTDRIRLDVVFLVNGVPVIAVETKAATKEGGLGDAVDQLWRYHREGPELMALMQVQTATQLVHFFYGATWSFSSKLLFNWRDEAAGEGFESLVKSFVHPQRVLRVLADFILFTRVDQELHKVLLRPHQMRAMDRVVNRAADAKRTRGLIWHTQGSGKTYTMITAAKKIIESPIFENPTGLMLVDRNELEAQLFGNLEAVGFGHVEVAESKGDLRDLLASDYRGLIVSTIHKFHEMPANICTRDNVIVLVDEAHRTTGGDLGNYLMGALPNATYIGFTGTPIDKTALGKGTFKVFGAADPKGYLDKYSIRESIRDGATVPLHYALAPNELRVDRDLLENEFLALAEAEGVSDVEELERILQRAVTLRTMLKNPDRMERVAKYVAEHYRSYVEPSGYKAFLVSVDRDACCRYKEALDQYLPEEYSMVVISPSHNDPPEISRYHLSENVEQQVRKAFRKPDEEPHILIVTEKLLTGFDAPILQTMYLDKPMRDHVLLQAIARVNRPYEDNEGRRKSAGLILDFVGLFEKLERALAFDSEDVEGLIEDLDVLRHHWERLVERARAEYLPLGAGLVADKEAEAILEHFRNRDRREEFYGFFREVEELYEILSPDPFLRPYLDEYGRLSAIYRLLRTSFEPHIDVTRSFLRKTTELVRDRTHSGEILDPKEIYRLDEGVLEALADSEKPDTVKVFNLVKVLEQQVRDRSRHAPYLVPIGERAVEVARLFYERQIDTQTALDELTKLLSEAQAADQRRQESDLSTEGFSVYFLLNRIDVSGAEYIARDMEQVFAEHPHWRTSGAQEREVRLGLYKALLVGDVDKVADVVRYVLSVLRRG
jgi:type I restriction enzyme R subunit